MKIWSGCETLCWPPTQMFADCNLANLTRPNRILPTWTSRSETYLALASHPPLLICFSERPTSTNTHTHTHSSLSPSSSSSSSFSSSSTVNLPLTSLFVTLWTHFLSLLVYLSHHFFFQFGSVNPYKHYDLFWGLQSPMVLEPGRVAPVRHKGKNRNQETSKSEDQLIYCLFKTKRSTCLHVHQWGRFCLTW